MQKAKKPFDLASNIVIFLTFSFFAAALYFKGMTHDLLLEAGVLLVSIKVILMQSKLSQATIVMEQRLDQIQCLLENIQK